MHQFLELIVSNQLIVMALSVVVWIVGKCGWIAKRPALVHVLWLMVLLKCLIPPLINVPIFPSAPQLSFAIETSNPTKAQSSHIGLNSRQLPSDLPNCNANVSEFKASTNGRVPLFADVPYIQDPVRLKSIHIFALLTGSLLGTIFISFHIALRMRMIGRLLKQHVALSERETLVLREVCRQVGVKNAPRLIVVDADVSPMLWGGLSSSTIFLPERLLGKIDDQRLLHILMHEMAHFVRRDHVSNTFAFLAVAFSGGILHYGLSAGNSTCRLRRVATPSRFNALEVRENSTRKHS
jgi:bla regulator protein BlaR1